jgi:hypothetical protein
MTVELLTPLDDYHDLHVIADGRRSTVKVDRQKLQNLLIDHSIMINALKKHGETCRDPNPQIRREKLQE